MASESWQKLHDGQNYKIYLSDTRGLDRLLLDRYTVAAPDGEVVTVAATMWGAQRAIRKHRRRGGRRKFWEMPLAGEVSDA